MCRNYDGGECVEPDCTRRITCHDFMDNRCDEHSINGRGMNRFADEDEDQAEYDAEPSRPGAGVLSFRGAPGGAVQGGCLCFEGTRIPVSTILGFMKAQDSDAAILDAYPSLTQRDLDAARWFDGKWQVRRRQPSPSSAVSS